MQARRGNIQRRSGTRNAVAEIKFMLRRMAYYFMLPWVNEELI
jgi:hypothetical protein